MLNKQKFLYLVQSGLPKFIQDKSEQLNRLLILWKSVENSRGNDYKHLANLRLPTWDDNLNYTSEVIEHQKIYNIIATDGSQVYPDRNEGILCYLLNIGQIAIAYNTCRSSIMLDSEPLLFFNNIDTDGQFVSDDLVNYQRAQLELDYGFEVSLNAFLANKETTLFLCDGSLTFFNFDNKENITENIFFKSHLAVMQNFYENKILVAGYISFPKSRELFSLIKNISNSSDLQDVLDVDIAQIYLNNYSRSNLFKNNFEIDVYYPEHLKTYFLYFNVKNEIVRIELPAWIALDNNLVDTVMSIILDQVIKGYGFPVVLSEAHMQAVIDGSDRQYFYNMLYECASKNGLSFSRSQKIIKKRVMSI